MVIPRAHSAWREKAATQGNIDMKIITTLGLLLVAVMSAPAARSQCAAGVDTGGQCIPPDALDPQGDTNPHARPQQPQVVWAARWGAFAIDETTSSIGISENQVSKSAASDQALQRCESKGNSSHCQVTYTYRNECSSLAVGTHLSYIGSDTDLSQADSKAMDGCSKGAADCKIAYHGCSPPVRVQ